jgi:hypothetical protein
MLIVIATKAEPRKPTPSKSCVADKRRDVANLRKVRLAAQSGRSGPWNSLFTNYPNETRNLEISLAPARAVRKSRLIPRYSVLVFGISRPSFIS